MKKSNQHGLSTVFQYGPGGELLWEKDANGNTKAYVWLEGRPLARIDNDASIYYYHVDHLGTPQAMTDAAGATVWKADYEPFGMATVKVSTVENNLRFPGQYYDRETGLHYNYFRDYEPGTGRYIEADPIGLDGGLNLYSYVDGNPLSYTDPRGLLKWTGSFDLKSGGAGKLGGTRGTFELTSECDIDGNQGFAMVVGISGSLGVGIPMSQTRGTVTFEDGHIRANPQGFNGRFTVDSIGIQIGPLGLGKTTIYLGEAVSTDVGGAGIDAGIQFGIYGRAEVISSGIRSCGCKTK